MTLDNRRRNIEAELRRGQESLESARVLLAADLRADAVSRAYYGAFHHARALLLTLGLEPASHGGVVSLLHREFVRTGRVDPDTARLLSRLQQFRHDADYTAEFAFSAGGAAEELAAANRFAAAVRGLLLAEGWMERDPTS